MLAVLLTLIGVSVLAGTLMNESDDTETTVSDDDLLIDNAGSEEINPVFEDIDILPETSQEQTGQDEIKPSINESLDGAEVDFSEFNNYVEITPLTDTEDGNASPLDDWNSNQSISVFDVEDDSVIYLDTQEAHSGHFIVAEANYIESSGNEEDDERIIHTGANVYFVPEGDTFPENYLWSEHGASLFDSHDFGADETDFGNISFVSRLDIDSVEVIGSLEDHGRNPEMLFLRLQSQIYSNTRIDFISLT